MHSLPQSEHYFVFKENGVNCSVFKFKNANGLLLNPPHFTLTVLRRQMASTIPWCSSLCQLTICKFLKLHDIAVFKLSYLPFNTRTTDRTKNSSIIFYNLQIFEPCKQSEDNCIASCCKQKFIQSMKTICNILYQRIILQHLRHSQVLTNNYSLYKV